MQFQVPQFIEVEDKIIGPFTLRQFIYLIGGAGMCYLSFRFAPSTFLLRYILMIPIAGFALALAFYKVNEKPFIQVVEAAVNYFFKNKLYIWQKVPKQPKPEAEETSAPEAVLAPKLSESKLKDLAWSLDITEKVNANNPEQK